jgi:hypothetical protein
VFEGRRNRVPDMSETLADTSSIPTDNAAVADAKPAKRKPNKRRARVSIDKRYALGRRVKQLTALFRARLGPDADDPITASAVCKAAELTALAEDMRARAFRGAPGALPDDLVRVQRIADLAVRRLQLDRHRKRDDGPTLSDILRESWDRRDDGGAP